MSKIQVAHWRGYSLKEFGYEHLEVVEEDRHELIDHFLTCGLQVMIYAVDHSDCEYVLWVDNRRFGQR